MSGLDINLSPIAAISEKPEEDGGCGDSPPPRYSEVVEDVEAGGDSGTGQRWRSRMTCSRPDRETWKKVFVVLMLIIIFVTFILAIVNSVRISGPFYRYRSWYRHWH